MIFLCLPRVILKTGDKYKLSEEMTLRLLYDRSLSDVVRFGGGRAAVDHVVALRLLLLFVGRRRGVMMIVIALVIA